MILILASLQRRPQNTRRPTACLGSTWNIQSPYLVRWLYVYTYIYIYIYRYGVILHIVCGYKMLSVWWCTAHDMWLNKNGKILIVQKKPLNKYIYIHIYIICMYIMYKYLVQHCTKYVVIFGQILCIVYWYIIKHGVILQIIFGYI